MPVSYTHLDVYKRQELPLPEVEADWSNYYKNVMDTIDGKAELIVKPCQVRRVFQVIEAAFASEKAGGALQVLSLIHI